MTSIHLLALGFIILKKKILPTAMAKRRDCQEFLVIKQLVILTKVSNHGLKRAKILSPPQGDLL